MLEVTSEAACSGEIVCAGAAAARRTSGSIRITDTAMPPSADYNVSAYSGRKVSVAAGRESPYLLWRRAGLCLALAAAGGDCEDERMRLHVWALASLAGIAC